MNKGHLTAMVMGLLKKDKIIMNISKLLGLTLSKVKGEDGDDQMIFITDDNRKFILYHSQDCCETVYLEDVIGDIEDLIGSPILVAEESSKQKDSDFGSETWTYYKIDTLKGGVTIRWFGSSNGYYSESVNFREEKGDN
jgi:hypothetical protein